MALRETAKDLEAQRIDVNDAKKNKFEHIYKGAANGYNRYSNR